MTKPALAIALCRVSSTEQIKNNSLARQREAVLKAAEDWPRQRGQPNFPCNNIVKCERCRDARKGRVVGFKHTNGKPNSTKVYEKYRCRECGRYINRLELHTEIEQRFKDHPITPEGLNDLLEALEQVWEQEEWRMAEEAEDMRQKIAGLNKTINQQVEAAIDPNNASIKYDILSAIDRRKKEVLELEDKLDGLSSVADDDKHRFLSFAFSFIADMGHNFLNTEVVSRPNRLRCKLLIFPDGFFWDLQNKVYTPEISPLITLFGTKKRRRSVFRIFNGALTG